ncbi:hypothetical protein [uncultured Nostoc sp.]
MTVTPLLAPEITVIETVTRHPLNFYESPSINLTFRPHVGGKR